MSVCMLYFSKKTIKTLKNKKSRKTTNATMAHTDAAILRKLLLLVWIDKMGTRMNEEMEKMHRNQKADEKWGTNGKRNDMIRNK